MENNVIKIRTLFKGWIEADKETAKKWVLGMLNGITTMNEQDKVKYLNSRLDGITVEELIKK